MVGSICNITALPAQVAEGLRTLMLGLYDVHLAPDGRSVDYPALVRDPNFADYTTAATELQKVGAQAFAQGAGTGRRMMGANHAVSLVS